MPCFFLKYSLPEWLASDLKSSVAAFYYVALFKKRVDAQGIYRYALNKIQIHL